MKKQKTRQELEKEYKKEVNTLAIMVIGLVCLFVFWMIMDEVKIDNLKTKLSECQDEIPVWNLTIKCNYVDVAGFPYSFTYEFPKLNSAQREGIEDFKNDYLKDENCEVIE